MTTRSCPFCGMDISVYPTTTEEQARAGLIYLAARCVPCNARFDSAGVGQEAALRDMDIRLERKRGTSRDAWRIRVGTTRRRQRR